MTLNGRMVVVTGDDSGIGRATGQYLARDGAAVAIWDIDGPGAEEKARLIEAAGGRAKGGAGIPDEAGQSTRRDCGNLRLPCIGGRRLHEWPDAEPKR